MSTDSRIESLEKQVRTLKRVLYTLCGFFVIAVLIAATNEDSVPDVIQAKKFQVVNDEGKTQVLLSASANGGLLSISNKDGHPAAAISADADGNGVVRTIDSKGKITSQSP